MTITPAYDPELIQQSYDAAAEREWLRLESGAVNRVSFHLHLWHLRRYIRAGDHVLDVGAGPGRFTIELARLGARVTVGDLSPTQLALNERKVREAGLEASVVQRTVMDIVDLSPLPADHFDATVCYGGPLSYVFDHADRAIGELLRVTKPGGYVLLSVMSLLGSCRQFLAPCLKLAKEHGPEVMHTLLETGDQVGVVAQTASGRDHVFRYYRWADLQALLQRHDCTIVDASAANFLATGRNAELLQPFLDDPQLWQAFLEWEVIACRQPGALDGGTHLIAIVRKPTK